MKASQYASRNGGRMETFIQAALRGKDEYRGNQIATRDCLRRHGLQSTIDHLSGLPFWVTNCAVDGFNSIYGVPWKLDIFLWHPVKARTGFVLEAKFQAVAGSCDDKLPFSVLSLDKIKQEKNVTGSALMLDAAGARDCVKEWVETECKARGLLFFDQTSAWYRFAQDTF